MKKKSKAPERVEPKFQETSVSWYAKAKMIDVYTTSHSEICLFKRRGWKPIDGKEGEQALPYLIFRIPRRALTLRSAKSVATKRPGPPRKPR